MLVTAVYRAVGYENAAHISEVVVADHSSLRGAALASGKVSAEQFESIVKPANIFGVDWRELTTHSFYSDAENGVNDLGDAYWQPLRSTSSPHSNTAGCAVCMAYPAIASTALPTRSAVQT
jgi:hypothetical protein